MTRGPIRWDPAVDDDLYRPVVIEPTPLDVEWEEPGYFVLYGPDGEEILSEIPDREPPGFRLRPPAKGVSR